MRQQVFSIAFFLIFSINFLNGQESKIEQKTLDIRQLRLEPGAYQRYKPNKHDENNNRFSTKDEMVKLWIPVTTLDSKFKITQVHNISRTGKLWNTTGILVVLDGIGPNSTDSVPVRGFIEAKIPFSSIQGEPLNKSRLGRHQKLVVWVIHDDEIGKSDGLGRCQLKFLKKYFKRYARSYGFRIPEKIKYECDDFRPSILEDIKRPKDQDGDVIGGN